MYNPIFQSSKTVETIELDPENIYVLRFKRGFEDVTWGLEMFLQSRDSCDIIITKEMMQSMKKTAEMFRVVQEEIKNATGYDLVIVHAFRADETSERLKREGQKPSSTSQHPYGEAVDIHVFLRGIRIRDPRVNYMIAILIDRIGVMHPELNICQIGHYTWGLHASIETERSKSKGIKKKIFRGAT